MRIRYAPWAIVKFIFSYINRGPWVLRGEKVERAVKITFDDFLKPAVEAGKPYEHLLHLIPEYETDLISTYHNLSWVHTGLGLFTKGYSSESELEVDFADRELDDDSNEEYDIMHINGYPFLLLSP